jgi:hypothetical protein
MSLRTILCVLALLALSTLAGAAMQPPMSPTLSSSVAVAATQSPTGVPSWLPAATGPAKKPGGKGSLTSNCATVCWDNARACIAGCDGDELCLDNCGADFTCCNQACNPNGPQCF